MTKISGSVKAASVTILVGLALVVTACASTDGGGGAFHGYLMRGSVVDVEGDQLVVCIGSASGASVDQTLTVYRVDKGPRASEPRFRRVKEGSVRVTAIIDEHFARATLVEGEAREGWIVELESR